MSTIRDAIIAVEWNVTGQDEINQTDEALQATESSAIGAAAASEDAGASMEDAGSTGARSFDDAERSAQSLGKQMGKIAAVSGAMSAALFGLGGFLTSAAAGLEEATIRMETFAGDQANAVRAAAVELEESSRAFFAAGDVMEAQAGALQRGIAAETVAELTPAVGNLATVAGIDLTQAFAAVESAMIRPERGFRQLAAQGLITTDTMEQIEKQMDGMSGAADRARQRQVILNAVLQEGTRRESAANAVRDSLVASTTALWSQLGNVAEVMGRPFLDPVTKGSQALGDFLGNQLKTNEAMIEGMGRAVLFGAVFFGLTAAAAGGVAIFSALTGAFGAATAAIAVGMGALVLKAAAIALVVVAVADFVSWLVRGESTLIDWMKVLDLANTGLFNFYAGWGNIIGLPVGDWLEAVGEQFREIVRILHSGELMDALKWIGSRLIEEVTKLGTDLGKAMWNAWADYSLRGGFTGIISDVFSAITDMMREQFRNTFSFIPGIESASNDANRPPAQQPQSSRGAANLGGSTGSATGGGSGGNSEITVRLRDDSQTRQGRENMQLLAEELIPQIQRNLGVEVAGSF